MRGTRALLALTIGMGVLIVVGTTALIVIIVHRLAHPAPASVAAAPVVPGAALPALQREPAGTRVTALARQSDTLLAIALSGGGPDRVLVWDLSAGRALTEIRLAP